MRRKSASDVFSAATSKQPLPRELSGQAADLVYSSPCLKDTSFRSWSFDGVNKQVRNAFVAQHP